MAVGIPVEMDLSSFIMEFERRLGYDSLKDKQVEAVSTFMKGNDNFVSLPGYWFRKSICILNIRYFTLCFNFDSTDTTLSRDKAAHDHVMYYGYHDRC